MRMSLLLGLSLACYSWSLDELSITPKQIGRLGIEFSQPEPLDEQFSVPWPALAMVMPANEFRMTLPLEIMVEKLFVNEGQLVEKGQLLVQLDSRDLRLWANDLLSAYDEYMQCEEITNRVKKRLELGLSTASELSRQQKECAKAGNDLDSAKGSLKHAGWDKKKIEALINTRQINDSLELIAPVSGIVYRLPIMPGNHLESGAELVTLWPLEQVKLQVRLPLSKARQLSVGQNCALVDGRSAKTEVISRLVSKDNRVTVWLTCDNLTPGERVNVRLPMSVGSSWLLPTKAVVRHDHRDWIFKKTPNGVIPVEVLRGPAKKRMVQVSGDLNADNDIAVIGTAALKGLWLGLGGE